MSPKNSIIDPEDVLGDSLQTLYDYTPITHSSAGSIFRYHPSPDIDFIHDNHGLTGSEAAVTDNARIITVRTPNTQAQNWSLHASSVWTSSIFVSDHLSDLHLDRHVAAKKLDNQETLHVLELGAGAGLPGILIAKCFPDVRVTSSDYPDEQLISALKDNIEGNRVGTRCSVMAYAWGSDPSALLAPTIPPTGQNRGSGYDVIVAADTLWNPELHGIFLQTLQIALRRDRNARIYLIAGLHTGRYTLRSFFDQVPDYGLEIEGAIEREVAGSGQRSWDVSRADGEDEKDRRKWVVWTTLRWKY